MVNTKKIALIGTASILGVGLVAGGAVASASALGWSDSEGSLHNLFGISTAEEHASTNSPFGGASSDESTDEVAVDDESTTDETEGTDEAEGDGDVRAVTPAVPAAPAVPSTDGGAATPAVPATPASPALENGRGAGDEPDED